jgi:hypothetical protein
MTRGTTRWGLHKIRRKADVELILSTDFIYDCVIASQYPASLRDCDEFYPSESISSKVRRSSGEAGENKKAQAVWTPPAHYAEAIERNRRSGIRVN